MRQATRRLRSMSPGFQVSEYGMRIFAQVSSGRDITHSLPGRGSRDGGSNIAGAEGLGNEHVETAQEERSCTLCSACKCFKEGVPWEVILLAVVGFRGYGNWGVDEIRATMVGVIKSPTNILEARGRRHHHHGDIGGANASDGIIATEGKHVG